MVPDTRKLVLSRGSTSADTYHMRMPRQVTAPRRKGIWPEARRITLYGWVMVAVLLVAPAETFTLVVTRHLPMLPSALVFLGGAAVGWLVAVGIFRFRGVGQVVLWILLFGLPLVALRESLRVTLGFAFGSALAWFPHCWRSVGMSNDSE
jgi:hypothetical protein